MITRLLILLIGSLSIQLDLSSQPEHICESAVHQMKSQNKSFIPNSNKVYIFRKINFKLP